MGDAYVVGHLHGRLIAFDLDGTLIDSSRDLADSVNDVLVEFGAPPLLHEAIVRMVGEGARILVRRALAASGLPETPEAVARFLSIYDTRLLNHTAPYDGVVDVVRLAREHARVAVLTNKPLEPSEKVLAGLGLRDLFDDVIGSDGPFPRKPDPAGLRALMERAGAAPDRTLMVGDSVVDYDTARNASARCCLVAYGFSHHTLAEVRISDAWVVPDVPGLAAIVARFVATG
jgi:phosphoglycolate phosphatase